MPKSIRDLCFALIVLKQKKYLKKLITNMNCNITESMKNLKEFLALRENRKEFDDAKKFGYVGIPAILTDDNKNYPW